MKKPKPNQDTHYAILEGIQEYLYQQGILFRFKRTRKPEQQTPTEITFATTDQNDRETLTTIKTTPIHIVVVTENPPNQVRKIKIPYEEPTFLRLIDTHIEKHHLKTQKPNAIQRHLQRKNQ